MRYSDKVLLIAFILSLAPVAISQSAPLVIAWQAPLCSDTQTNCSNSALYPYFNTFLQSELPNISGVGVTVLWGQVDSCGSSQCSGQNDDCVHNPTVFQWCTLDQELLNFINLATSFANKKIVLIINPVNDQSRNNSNFTPQYVFSQNWADHVDSCGGATHCPPQEVVVCSGWKGDIPDGGTCPVSGSINSGDWAIWNVNGGSSGCTKNGNGDLTCQSCSGGVTDFSGFPVLYEKPFLTAYQQFLAALAAHYNPITGTQNGMKIAPYIAYVRVGMANGGENLPGCTTTGYITQDTWSQTSFPAGYIVNSNGTQYIATGTGKTGQAMPTCSPAGCTTAADGAIPGWYNAGPYPQPITPSPLWPGPNGQFSTLPPPYQAQPFDYSDNGYLSEWHNIIPGTQGYIASMLSFLKGLGASFPFDISAHTGPPGNGNNAYADSESIIASTNGVGFGKQSVNIGDGVQFVLGAYPTTLENWAYNFKTYPAPVHHLQTESPGGMYKAAGYQIQSISIGSCAGNSCIATLDCPGYPQPPPPLTNVDCQFFAGSPIYITGNSNPALNGIWQACPPNTALQCSTDQIQFSVPNPMTDGMFGIVWAGDYWPITMPFAVQHGVTSIEVWECDLDFAFGVQSTFWAPDESDGGGCAEWGVSGPPGTTAYQSSLATTLTGQPSATSVRAGKNSLLAHGSQF